MKTTPIKLLLACSVMLMVAMAARSQPLSINTLAGNGTQGATNGFGSNARFNHPAALTGDAFGNIFVADTENSTIRKVTPDGFVSTLAGLAGNFGNANGSGGSARFYGPQGIAADTAGNLYVADTANATIRKIFPDGTVSAFAGSAGSFNSFDGTGSNAQFYQPEGVAVDGGGNVYVADAWNHTIRKITPAGIVTTLAGLAGYSGATDGTNSKVRFNRPTGIALDGATNLFVTDSLNHTIRKITPAGKVSTIAGLAGVWGNADGTNNVARFFQPEGILVANAATLFVADSGNQLIRKLSAIGTNWVVTSVAGLTGIAGSTNGAGLAAQFYFPAGMALDNAGYLYIADSGNNLIRTTRVVPPTLQVTKAGNLSLISWPTSEEGFILESSPMLGVGVLWSPVTNNIPVVGDNFQLTKQANSGTAFYRLRKPQP